MSKFVGLVKKIMNEKNINGNILAKKTGVSSVYIYDLLKGRRRWNESMIDKVCNILGIEIEFKHN